MIDAKSYGDVEINVKIDRLQLREKLNNAGISYRIMEILKEPQMEEFIQEHLIKSVRKYAVGFMTQMGRDFYERIISTENLFTNLRINIEANLLSNAINNWLLNPEEMTLENWMNVILDENFVMKAVEALDSAIRELQIQMKEEEFLKMKSDTENSYLRDESESLSRSMMYRSYIDEKNKKNKLN